MEQPTPKGGLEVKPALRSNHETQCKNHKVVLLQPEKME